MHQPIRTLLGSALHRTNVELYQRHDEAQDGSGRCVTCRQPTPCLPRRHAAAVILAAGEPPQAYDRQAPPAHHPGRIPPPVPDPCRPRYPPPSSHPPLATSGVTGYAVSSRDFRRPDAPTDTGGDWPWAPAPIPTPRLRG